MSVILLQRQLKEIFSRLQKTVNYRKFLFTNVIRILKITWKHKKEYYLWKMSQREK